MWSASPTPPRNLLSLSREAPIGSLVPLPSSPVDIDDQDANILAAGYINELGV